MGRIGKSFIVFFTISLLFSQAIMGAAEVNEPQVQVRLQEVALFKNGLGFFVSEVTCPEKKGTFGVVPFAAASHGTFWASYSEKVILKSMIAKEADSLQQIEVGNIPELMRANVGRRVKVNISNTEIKGNLVYFGKGRENVRPNPYVCGTSDFGEDDQRREGGQVAIIQTDAGEISINPQSVNIIEFPDEAVKKTFTSKKKAMQLDINLEKPAGGEKIILSYLAKGVTWAPSYIVDIGNSEKAQLSAKAEVINEVCDIVNVKLQLVTGFPNLQFADVMSPFALKENLAQFLEALTRGESQMGSAVTSNLGVRAVRSQQASRYDMEMSSSSIMPGYGAAKAGLAAEDMFFYPVENVNLPKGTVGYFPLFTQSVPYKHIYQWSIADYISDEDRYYGGDRRNSQKQQEEEVWHCLRLTNNGNVPWTTAPAQITKDGLILGQDTLNFTPAKSQSTLRITRAVNVKAEQRELETARKQDASQLYGHHYDLITLEGKLSISNLQDKDITLEITKTLSGEVKSSEPEAKIEKLARGLSQMNGLVKLVWTIELKPGEQKSLSYVYEVYVRR